jgi:hypothetical protein
MGYPAGSIALISRIEQASTKEEFGDQSAALEVARIPEIPWVCDEGQSGSITCFEIHRRTRPTSQFFLQCDPLVVDVPDLLFVHGDERGLGRGKQAVEDLGLPALYG